MKSARQYSTISIHSIHLLKGEENVEKKVTIKTRNMSHSLKDLYRAIILFIIKAC